MLRACGWFSTVWLVRDDVPPAFVVVGEALIDLSPPAEDGSCIARPGGSPMNVAIGLARLGQPTAFASLSADPFGTVLRRHLERSAVGLQHIVPAADPSTIALVELASGQARYQFSLGADFQWQAAELAFLPGWRSGSALWVARVLVAAWRRGRRGGGRRAPAGWLGSRQL